MPDEDLSAYEHLKRYENRDHRNQCRARRLTLEQLQRWEALKFGMFIHFGMSTFDGEELSKGDLPSTAYAPDKLDVDQWVCVARDAGMKYAVLTTKHVAGHCLWPTKPNDYHVGTSGNKTDVVEAFVKACDKRGVIPGLYYCSWDNHNVFGSQTPTHTTDWQRTQRQEILHARRGLRSDRPRMVLHRGLGRCAEQAGI